MENSTPSSSTQDIANSTLEALKPIRDLAQNWDIDIDKCLREYIEEVLPELDLSSQTISKINFAEAALVLQNSSHVYSRKVEHLYNLVYQALEAMTAGNQNQHHQRKGGKSQEIDDFFEFDPQQEFLLLDDILPTDDTEDCRQINLTEEGTNASANANQHRRQSISEINLSIDMSKTVIDAQIKSANAAGSTLRLVDGNCDIGADGCLLLPGTQNSQHPTIHADTLNHYEQGVIDMPFDDGDDDGGGFTMMDDYDVETTTVDNQQAQAKERRNVTFADTVINKKDPWELIDPHKPDKKYKAKPLRIAKTIRLPPGIDNLPSDCVNGASTRRVARSEPNLPQPPKPVVSIAAQTFQATLRKRRHESPTKGEKLDESPVVPLQGLAFGNEFAYIAKANAKRKAAERRAKRKLEKKERVESMYEDDDEDDGGFPFDDDDNDYADDDAMGNTGFASVDQAYQHDANNDGSMDDEDYEQTFEDLCRAHLRAFAKGAEKYAAETQLSRRVGEWQDKLVPVLDEEERRGEFDIHSYGETVISRLEKEIKDLNPKGSDKPTQKVVDFKSVTRTCQRYEVCRMFLATLSLSNSGNVHLDSGENQDELHVELLRSDIDRPMETYLAPSVVTNEN